MKNQPFASPLPSGDHELPFQRATQLAAVPPMLVNEPPTIQSPLGSSSMAAAKLFEPPPGTGWQTGSGHWAGAVSASASAAT